MQTVAHPYALATEKLVGAFKVAGPAAAKLREGVGPFIRNLGDKAKPAAEAAGLRAAEIFGELQAAALREARKVEALEPYATEDNAKVAVSVMLGLPAFLITYAALGMVWPLFRRSKIVVPKSVARESVPLRTPTPEKRTKGRSGGTIKSPEGDVLHFA